VPPYEGYYEQAEPEVSLYRSMGNDSPTSSSDGASSTTQPAESSDWKKRTTKSPEELTQSKIDIHRYDAAPLDISGYLLKRGDRGAILAYKRRYFRLYQGERLFYYKDKRDEGKTPLGSISLHYVLSVEGMNTARECCTNDADTNLLFVPLLLRTYVLRSRGCQRRWIPHHDSGACVHSPGRESREQVAVGAGTADRHRTSWTATDYLNVRWVGPTGLGAQQVTTRVPRGQGSRLAGAQQQSHPRSVRDRSQGRLAQEARHHSALEEEVARAQGRRTVLLRQCGTCHQR